MGSEYDEQHLPSVFVVETEYLLNCDPLQIQRPIFLNYAVTSGLQLSESLLVQNNKSDNIHFLQIFHSLLQKLAESVIIYVRYQADCGAQAVQIFDSWATHLSPIDFEVYSLPYLKQIVSEVKSTHPNLPLILYASGSGGLLERMASTGVDVLSIDWTVDMAEARQRIGTDLAVQVHSIFLSLCFHVFRNVSLNVSPGV